MIQREYVEDLSKKVGEEVTLKGWLYNKRSSGKIQFELLRDGTGICQCVVVKNVVGADVFAACDAITQESAIAVTGTVQATDKAPGGYELSVSKVEIISNAGEYPIT